MDDELARCKDMASRAREMARQAYNEIKVDAGDTGLNGGSRKPAFLFFACAVIGGIRRHFEAPFMQAGARAVSQPGRTLSRQRRPLPLVAPPR